MVASVLKKGHIRVRNAYANKELEHVDRAVTILLHDREYVKLVFLFVTIVYLAFGASEG